MKKFNPGDAIVFEPANFDPEFWSKLSEEDRIKYYGPLGYGHKPSKVYVFITEINQAPGHCAMITLRTGKVESMCHMDEFRLATEDEM